MKKTVIAYPHIHFDREWYREFEEFRIRLVEIFDVIFEEFKKGELEKFYFDGQTSSIEDYLQIHPENENKIKQLIKEGKLFLGPFYCLSDLFLTDEKCIRKNLDFGIRKAQELGYDGGFIGYLADTFGHSNSIPKILSDYNIDHAIIWRGVGDLPSEFMWNGIKTTNLVYGYYHDEFHQNIDYEQKANIIKKSLDKIAEKSSDVILLPIGGDHLCPPRNLKTQIKEINKHLDDYEIQVGTPFDYFKLVKDNYNKTFEGEFLDNSKTFLLKGSYSCRSYIKQKNSKSQWLLAHLAEPLNNLFTGKFKNEIDEAYKLIIQNHAHDSIYGCSTDDVDFEVQSRYKKANQISKGIIKRLFRDNITQPYQVVNLSDKNYSGAIEIESKDVLPKWLNAQELNTFETFLDSKLYNIFEVPVTEDITSVHKYLIDVNNIPSMAVAELHPELIETKSALLVSENTLENRYLKVYVHSAGIDILDKTNAKLYKNIFHISDRSDVGDSYNFAPLKNEIPTNAKLTDTKIKELGHIRSILSLYYSIFNEEICVDLILHNQSKYIEFQIKYNNVRKNHLLQAVFNTPKDILHTTSEDTAGIITRTIDASYKLEEQIPAPKGTELKINTFPMQRFVCANDVGVVSKGLQEYECVQNSLKITLLRSTDIISNPKNPARGTPAGPPLKFKGLECLGENTYKLALTFDTKNIKQIADNFYGSILTAQW